MLYQGEVATVEATMELTSTTVMFCLSGSVLFLGDLSWELSSKLAIESRNNGRKQSNKNKHKIYVVRSK